MPALHALPEYELKAVCTAHEDTALASQKAFGTDLAFHNFDEMLACPEIDLVTVVTRVPTHYDLVMRALRAGKAVYCEWPLGATLEQAEQMADLAAERSLYTAVGLQAHSDPTLMYARELIQQGYIGEVLAVDFAYIGKATTRRGSGRIWQSDRRAGANILTIGGGHAIDALSFVLGDFTEVSARLATMVTEWHNTDTGETVPVDSPDWVSVSGRLRSNAEVSFLVAAVPALPDGRRTFEIYGREGMLSIGVGAGSRRAQSQRLSRPEPAVRRTRQGTAGADGDSGPLHADTRQRARRSAAKRRPGVCASGARHGGGQAVRPGLRPRRQGAQIGRRAGAVVGSWRQPSVFNGGAHMRREVR